MFASHRDLSFTIIVCALVIMCAAAYKLGEVNKANDPITSRFVSVSGSNQVKKDKTFFEDSQPVSDTKIVKPAPSETKPSSPVSAEAYIVGNARTGKIYLQSNAEKVLPVASMSKLITAIAATDSLKADEVIPVTEEEAKAPPDASMLQPGEKFTLSEILYPMLLSSSNVAAEAIASSTNRIDFFELMSSYAWEIGMPSAFFADPSGVSSKNIASAHDIFNLAKYLYSSRPDILAITKNPTYNFATTSDHGYHDLKSTHPFVNDPSFLGGKTGRTPEAGDTMMTIMNVNGEPIVVVVLKSKYDGRAEDTKYLLDLYKKQLSVGSSR